MISDRVRRGIVPFQQVLGFAIAQWARHPATLAAIVACVATWTLSDVLMPVFAGRLIDALSSPDRTTALRAAVSALGGMVGLGVTLVAARHLSFLGITRLTLKVMTEVARSGFARVQRLTQSTGNTTRSARPISPASFGPVLSILTYEDDEQVIRMANDTVHGLAAYVRSGDLDHARRVAARMRAGNVHINDPGWDGAAPFGGYKQSGNGRDYADFGLEEFLGTKAVIGYAAA